MVLNLSKSSNLEQLALKGLKTESHNDWHTIVCFEVVHNFTESEIKHHQISIMTTTDNVLISPHSASEQQTNQRNVLCSFHYRNAHIQLHCGSVLYIITSTE